MQFAEAIAQSIKMFKEGKLPESTLSLQDGETKYTPEYFDELETEMSSLSDQEIEKEALEVEEETDVDK